MRSVISGFCRVLPFLLQAIAERSQCCLPNGGPPGTSVFSAPRGSEADINRRMRAVASTRLSEASSARAATRLWCCDDALGRRWLTITSLWRIQTSTNPWQRLPVAASPGSCRNSWAGQARPACPQAQPGGPRPARLAQWRRATSISPISSVLSSSILEVMAAGCLVIGSDTASVGEEGIQQHPAAPAEKDNETYYQNNVSITYLKSGFYG